ncbi:MAG: hypothetical protein GY801_36485, partial [bacterium]|nr:hypothetical protein [bacterium]
RQYLAWITRYITFYNRHEPDTSTWRHPKECGRHEIEAFLTHLAVSTGMWRLPPKIKPCAPWCSCIGKS